MSRLFNTKRTRFHTFCGMSRLSKLLVRSDGSLFLLNREEIQWIEAKGQKSLLHCGNHSYSIRGCIQVIEHELDPKQFVRIHRSYIVNLNKIRQLKPRTTRGYDVILDDGTELIWSRHYKNRFHAIEQSALTIP
jgi:two-component system, LytTR family, response regulator